jgi:hypothetical protein
MLPERRRAHAGLVVAAHLHERMDPHRVALLAEEGRGERATMALEAIDRARRGTLGKRRASLVQQDALGGELGCATRRHDGCDRRRCRAACHGSRCDGRGIGRRRHGGSWQHTIDVHHSRRGDWYQRGTEAHADHTAEHERDRSRHPRPPLPSLSDAAAGSTLSGSSDRDHQPLASTRAHRSRRRLRLAQRSEETRGVLGDSIARRTEDFAAMSGTHVVHWGGGGRSITRNAPPSSAFIRALRPVPGVGGPNHPVTSPVAAGRTDC